MSMTKTEIRYYWKELTDEGRLIDVTYREPYAYNDSTLGYYGYESESDAVKDLEISFTTEFTNREFVLIKTYTIKKV